MLALTTEQISQILEREQRNARLVERYAQQPRRLAADELQVTAPEDRQGAGLLRKMIPKMDAVTWDDEVVVFRVALSAEMVMQLELWGCDTENMEASHDLEAWLYDGDRTG